MVSSYQLVSIADPYSDHKFLNKNDSTAKKQMSKLKIYRGDKHPHKVQNPKEISLVQMNKKNLLRN